MIYCWQRIFFLGSLCARFFFYPITMYDFFLSHFLSQHFFFNSLYYLDSLIIVNVQFSSCRVYDSINSMHFIWFSFEENV